MTPKHTKQEWIDTKKSEVTVQQHVIDESNCSLFAWLSNNHLQHDGRFTVVEHSAVLLRLFNV